MIVNVLATIGAGLSDVKLCYISQISLSKLTQLHIVLPFLKWLHCFNQFVCLSYFVTIVKPKTQTQQSRTNIQTHEENII